MHFPLLVIFAVACATGMGGLLPEYPLGTPNKCAKPVAIASDSVVESRLTRDGLSYFVGDRRYYEEGDVWDSSYKGIYGQNGAGEIVKKAVTSVASGSVKLHMTSGGYLVLDSHYGIEAFDTELRPVLANTRNRQLVTSKMLANDLVFSWGVHRAIIWDPKKQTFGRPISAEREILPHRYPDTRCAGSGDPANFVFADNLDNGEFAVVERFVTAPPLSNDLTTHQILYLYSAQGELLHQWDLAERLRALGVSDRYQAHDSPFLTVRSLIREANQWHVEMGTRLIDPPFTDPFPAKVGNTIRETWIWPSGE